MDMDINGMGERIRNRRMELDMSLEQLGSLVDLSKASLSRLEMGQVKTIKIYKLMAIANALNIPPNKLLGFEVAPEVEQGILEKMKVKKKVLDIIDELDTEQLKKTYSILSTIFKQ